MYCFILNLYFGPTLILSLKGFFKAKENDPWFISLNIHPWWLILLYFWSTFLLHMFSYLDSTKTSLYRWDPVDKSWLIERSFIKWQIWAYNSKFTNSKYTSLLYLFLCLTWFSIILPQAAFQIYFSAPSSSV
jgi:hypothetical protein